jgi:hypothetical protein
VTDFVTDNQFIFSFDQIKAPFGGAIMEERTEESPRVHAPYPSWHNPVAGSVAGAGSRMATAPLDLIRIRRQLNVVSYPRESLWGSWKSIVKNEGGVSALFRGNVAAIFLWISYSAVQFSLYTQTRDWLIQHAPAADPEDSDSEPAKYYRSGSAFVAGATAGVCATIATYPFDVCRTTFAARGIQTTGSALTPSKPPPITPKATIHHMPFSSLVEPMIHDRGRFASSPPKPISTPPLQPHPSFIVTPPTRLYDFVWYLYRQKGIAGFYAGAGPAVLQIIPYMGISFWLYDQLTAGDRRVALSAYAGSISGAVSKILVYPMDTVKRRLQAQAFYDNSSATESRTGGSERRRLYSGLRDCFTRVIKEEGWASLYRGVVPSVLKTTISTGLSFALFRSTKNILEGLHEDCPSIQTSTWRETPPDAKSLASTDDRISDERKR